MRRLRMYYLNDIHSAEDIKKLNVGQLNILSEEIRDFLIDSVSKTGGHLSSNLGTIDLTLALHKVFTTPHDEIVWDVGHQCYTHKIVTGRKDDFAKLRMLDGISGFPAPSESVHDAFVSGHGNTSIPVAVGLAAAKAINGDDGKVIAVIGDGAFTGGMVYEGLNNVRSLSNLIVILNDNEMSISKNVGAVARYFTKLRTNPQYFAAKRNVQSVLDAIPVIGKPIRIGMQNVKTAFRHLIYNSTMFEDMGFQYIGPVDGHDIEKLVKLFSAYKNDQSAPVFIHAVTKKGKGFAPAEENPGEFHGVSSFDPNHLTEPDVAPDSSFSVAFGEHIAKLAETDDKLCAITAAMKYGTGLQFFYKKFPKRFFDVGMAEQLAVTFAGGLAKEGMKPIVAIYSTFLQRSFDQIMHDVNLMKLDVLFAVDRAGFVPGDGETHQGIYDAAFLSEVTGLKISSPCNYAELYYWTDEFLKAKGPHAIRYQRGAEAPMLSRLGCTKNEYDIIKSDDNSKCAFVTFGAETEPVLCAQKLLKNEEINADVVKMTVINPLPNGIADALLKYDTIIFAEEGIKSGGIGEHLAKALLIAGYRGKYIHLGADSNTLTHATIQELRAIFKLDENSLAQVMKEEQH
ncbi:MAG: 1-deoxy-D-xylulose-5-phosphate synthase [Ruminococcaceae bacterium]|nr:1-deoxy-D-xylulose-5-phosphate synthase [Oscillospiraceae bacterium]